MADCPNDQPYALPRRWVRRSWQASRLGTGSSKTDALAIRFQSTSALVQLGLISSHPRDALHPHYSNHAQFQSRFTSKTGQPIDHSLNPQTCRFRTELNSRSPNLTKRCVLTVRASIASQSQASASTRHRMRYPRDILVMRRNG